MNRDTLSRAGENAIHHGQIGAINGRWHWPCAMMGIGDTFDVDPEDKPIGGVRNAVNSAGYRLGMKFSTTMVNGMILVERVALDSERTAGDANEARINIIGGDGGDYLGVLQAPFDGGRWAWPFKRMQPGQFFHVDHNDRHPEEVRQLAHVRAGTLGYSVSVRADDPEKPGFTRVEYVDKTRGEEDRDKSYAATNSLLSTHYDFTFDDLNLWHLQDRPFEPQVLVEDHLGRAVHCEQKPRFDKIVLKMDYASFGIEFFEDRLVVTGLPKGMTYAQWLDVDPFS